MNINVTMPELAKRLVFILGITHISELRGAYVTLADVSSLSPAESM